ncbi:hypothetical protein [Mycobacteroides abscessus]|uniref:hypothetical protein n=1 Tax=Mycobacteroides abscessus TaxID=36809 RepID=UPI0009277CE1|nr:hypothetical protein [Mycobacteroides abscessus]SHP20878.1 Uncharacterised protein [Mycobacteroides abscessus subsp. abscessus]SHP58988.1 Uncharacterised protein [Mycobacteroides abscessus subsp. abscessus]SHP59102.1 Uncharacterised protein [Mycobacteroides abscessus subsp. abscessus]SHP82998.1 Uncharacterised protein [Mycobacteroides abscessus subsp. abscessus]SHP93711.1 Uncharacterised protein [Mycobacteroides abscessus subsp. abscessus]
MNPAERAADRLLALIARTRSENPGTSPDPYLDGLALWVSVVPQVREVLAAVGTHESTLGEVEYLFREAVTAWLRGDEPYNLLTDDPGTAALLADDELEHRLRTVLDPPAVWVF